MPYADRLAVRRAFSTPLVRCATVGGAIVALDVASRRRQAGSSAYILSYRPRAAVCARRSRGGIVSNSRTNTHNDGRVISHVLANR
jgi:hypothetical protein